MAQLVVRRIEEILVQKLRERAAREGISVEEAHRRVLRTALLGTDIVPSSFKDYLRAMPELAGRGSLERKRKRSKRGVDL